MEYKCSCESTEFFVKKKGTQYGLYCKKCGKWQKWLGKNERNFIGVKWQEIKE